MAIGLELMQYPRSKLSGISIAYPFEKSKFRGITQGPRLVLRTQSVMTRIAWRLNSDLRRFKNIEHKIDWWA
jgi:hypothetical protein